jgi:hypothetical protein
MSCGCNKLNDSHGDERNITMSTLQRAAEAAGMNVEEVKQNMAASLNAVSGRMAK